MTRDDIQKLIEESAENRADAPTLADLARLEDGGERQ